MQLKMKNLHWIQKGHAYGWTLNWDDNDQANEEGVDLWEIWPTEDGDGWWAKPILQKEVLPAGPFHDAGQAQEWVENQSTAWLCELVTAHLKGLKP